MIQVLSNLSDFEYENEIHALTKAFYPEEEIRVIHEGGTEEAPPCLIFIREGEEELRMNPSLTDRDDFKRSLYRALSSRTGKELPWGALTGIRPVRLAMRRFQAGMTEDEIVSDMEDRYYVSREKAELSAQIASLETELLSELVSKQSFSLYLDIPFCPSRCLYCSFASNPLGRERKKAERYLEALSREIRGCGSLLSGRKPNTVYIGGGTPTSLHAEELQRLFEELQSSFDLSELREFTVEAGRPDSIDRSQLRVMKRYGVTRICVNPQTMNDETLRRIGRRHTAQDVREAFALAREEGFDHINMDIILGLPGETKEDVAATVEEIGKLLPDSLTVHSLALKRASVLAERIREEGFSHAGDTTEMMRIASEAAQKMGMKPYYLYRQKNMSGNLENTGFALPGKYGLYNILINEEVQDIVALGAGAISKKVDEKGGCRRAANYKELHQYTEHAELMLERKRELFSNPA